MSAYDSARLYRAKGWSGTLPLPAGQKSLPPAGFTGYDGVWPTDGHIAEWQANGIGQGNLGLRFPPTVLGLDVDDYGSKLGGVTLAELSSRWGPLPETWTATSREDISGIRLFKVPHEIPQTDWPTEAGPGIEIIRYAHRYAVVPPSIHPEGRPYRWRKPDGTWADEDELPGLSDLPHLPSAWVTGLTGHGSTEPHAKPGSRKEKHEQEKQATEWIAALPSGMPCSYVGRLEADLMGAARREDGDAYDHTRDVVMALLRAGETGHRGVSGTLERGRDTYAATVMGDRGGGRSQAEGEYDRFTVGGVVKLLADPRDRAATGCDCDDPGTSLPTETTEPIAYEDLASTLDATVEHLRRFVRFSDPAQAIAVTLWVAHSHIFARADTSPILWIRSAVAESGKTRVFETIEPLVPRPWVCERPSEAVVYRKIDRDKPTLLLDEIDTILKDRSGSFEGLRAIFNAGNRRGTVVSRAMESGKALTDFEIFCPKAVAGLDTIPDTMKTRAIPIVLQRRAKHERIERLRRRTAQQMGTPLREALAHHLQAVEVLWLEDEAFPQQLSDRQMDSWESLLAIADAAGGDWPEQARKAAVVLHSGTESAEDSWGLRLLADTRVVFSDSGSEWITSADLIAKLEKIEESPWGDIHGKTITKHYLAKLLRDFNIRPRQYRDHNDEKQRGYAADTFTDAWSRYLPAYPEVTGTNGTSGTASTHVVPDVPVVPLTPGESESVNTRPPIDPNSVEGRYLRIIGEAADEPPMPAMEENQ